MLGRKDEVFRNWKIDDLRCSSLHVFLCHCQNFHVGWGRNDKPSEEPAKKGKTGVDDNANPVCACPRTLGTMVGDYMKWKSLFVKDSSASESSCCPELL